MRSAVGRSFVLDDKFIATFADAEPNFGYGGLGELVYRRTYSRLLDGDDAKREEWYQTVRRVVEGIFSMQKYHFTENNLKWDEADAVGQAEDMYQRIFDFKFLPPGRGLWACGTALTAERGNFSALQNCAFVSSWNAYKDSFEDPFCFCFDMSQCGVGVGFDTEGAGCIPVLAPTGTVDHTVGDSREGWVKSLRLLLRAFFYGEPIPVFDYSQIRKAGSIIKGFGGVSQGPAPLEKLHQNVVATLEPLIRSESDPWNSDKGFMTITAIVDIFNYIGACVIAGNIRR
jgi:ribonucleoside-triphosphate reductase (thioredoxin)